MDDQHLVQFRIALGSVPALKIKYPNDVDVAIHKADGPFLAERAHGNWFVLPQAESRGLPEAKWKDIWGDELIDIEINLGDGWKKIESWEELNAVPIQLPRAAE